MYIIYIYYYVITFYIEKKKSKINHFNEKYNFFICEL